MSDDDSLDGWDVSIIAQALQHYAYYLGTDPLHAVTPVGNARRADRALEIAWKLRPNNPKRETIIETLNKRIFRHSRADDR